MKQIGLLYFRDIKNIVSNWVATIIILGLVFLPSLYAWFNIKASWDPYSQTGGLTVAVTNNDKGTILRGTPINIGNEVIASLKENHKIGWTFVNEQEAMRGVLHGDYYASIVIPADFSAKIGTVLTDNPQKAELVYSVNEKINAIAPKITAKGASGIVDEISRNFIKTANGTIFRIFNEIGLELEVQRPMIEKMRNLIFKMEAMFPTINQTVNIALEDINKANGIVRKAQTNLPIVAELTQDGMDVTQKFKKLLDRTTEALDALSPTIKQDLFLLQQTAMAMEQLTDILQDTKIEPAVVKAALNQASRRLSTGIAVTEHIIALFDRLNNLAGGNRLSIFTGKLKQIRNHLQQQLATVNTITSAIDQGEKPAAQLINHLDQLSRKTSVILDDILQRYDNEIQSRILQAVENTKKATQRAYAVLVEANKSIPDVQRLLHDAAQGLTIGNQELSAIQKNLPAIEARIKGLADWIRTMEKEGTLDQLINLLINNTKKTSEFFAEPVVLKENKLFPIPNYGSAMSPFFTTLSLWVGALLLVSLLTVEVHHHDANYKSYQIYFGRYLTFMTLAVLQSLMVTLGDIFLLGTYVVDKLWFVLFGMLLSSVFMLIVYTLVSVFGNVGKAMAIVLLVLQLAGSGGTFPIQVTPPFFQAIHPYLPFTYAISMMREAVGGILWDIIGKDLLMMAVYVAIALVIGVALKDFLNRSSARFVEKAKESKLIH
ncbi:YhgE/Pip domain-containing protein [Aneurinibacillus thermoaerophilus]|uniref:Putative membrane protein n=1 Tax=Aneurinibacillus thermoaerophilus TaxID=143495 RepID=A0A1G7XE26_ANETH|nr:YhgE/Pip domain-containing protein [Aneurinibacillus thermoaerophilus]MED0736237.1 YhgE/Pip domain-containing protein [Aneurinibacillus thermoaerophilus]SDG82394.1 putative membrane protein [Aneurinibacillus thermoaerophilus]